MPLFWFHDSKGLPMVHLERVTGRYARLYGDSEPGDFLSPCFMYHGRKEISPLRCATVEMTGMGAGFSVIWGVRFLHSASVEMTGPGHHFYHLRSEVSPLPPSK